MSVKDSNVSLQRFIRPPDPLATLLSTGHVVLAMCPFVKDANCRVRKCLSAFLASQFVRFDVVFVLVLFREKIFVEFKLFAAVLTHGNLGIIKISIILIKVPAA